jgi:hypothetical protein
MSEVQYADDQVASVQGAVSYARTAVRVTLAFRVLAQHDSRAVGNSFGLL